MFYSPSCLTSETSFTMIHLTLSFKTSPQDHSSSAGVSNASKHQSLAANSVLKTSLSQLPSSQTCLASTSYDVRAASLKAVVPFFTALHQQLTSESTSSSTTQESAHDTATINSSNSNSTKQASRGRSSHLSSAAAAILLAHQPALDQLSTLLTALLARVVSGDAVAKVVRRALQVQALLGGIRSAAAAAAVESEKSRLLSFSSPSNASPCFLMLINNLSLQGVSEYGSSTAAASPSPSPSNTTNAADSTTATAADIVFPAHATDANSRQLAAQEPSPDVVDTVATLQRLYERATDFRTQAQALRCLGHSIGSLITATHQDTSAADLPRLQSTLHTFMQSVIGCSAATQPEELREAAVETLHACGLLLLPSKIRIQSGSNTTDQDPHTEVDALLLPLQRRALQQLVLMMEDEDKGVRERAAVLAAAAVLDSRLRDGGARCDGDLPVCIESVSKQLMVQLVERFGSVEGVSWGGGASEFVLDGGSRATLQLLVARAVSSRGRAYDPLVQWP